jgi:hypothetical protein
MTLLERMQRLLAKLRELNQRRLEGQDWQPLERLMAVYDSHVKKN